MEELLGAIIAQLHEADGMVDHALGKRLGISMSQLNRALALLCTSVESGGLGLVTTQQDEKRRTLWLTERGHALCRP